MSTFLRSHVAMIAFVWLALVSPRVFAGESNLIEDPSLEAASEPNRIGMVFNKWFGWKYDGECSFGVGHVAHGGKCSALLRGVSSPKIRFWSQRKLDAGRYRTTVWIRGLDIGAGASNQTTEFMFNWKYIPLNKNGTFGWTKLTYVGDVPKDAEGKDTPMISIGLMAPGLLWIDDASCEKVGTEVPLTETPVLSPEEAPIVAPSALGATAIHCPECAYRNMPEWRKCYACGADLSAPAVKTELPLNKVVSSFEEENTGWGGGTRVTDHATDGKQALRIDAGLAALNTPQDWQGYDFLKMDFFTDTKDPANIQLTIRDAQSTNYWTWVNYYTVIPPGQSTLVIPVKQLYVGEKQFPGRMLLLEQITQLAVQVGDKPLAPIYLDNIRLERDQEPEKVKFNELIAYDLGPVAGPVMEGFAKLTPDKIYSPGRGYGFKNANIWRTFDVLQPDPLYQDCVCIQGGGIAVDVPNGKYRVCLNIDFAGGFWGEIARFRNRKVFAEGKEVVNESMDFEAFKKKRYQSWDVEVLPTDNTFDIFQKRIFHEKVFDVDVQDGQLNVDFEGLDFTCALSSFIAFPLSKTTEGEKFLKYVDDRRRFHFNNNAKRVLHRPTGDPLAPTDVDKKRGYIAFSREFMRELYYNDTPLKSELGRPFVAHAFAGEIEPLSVCLLPLQDLGKVTVDVTDLKGPGGTIPASAISTSFVSYRLLRSNLDGTVYTITPRILMPRNAVGMPKDIARRFLLTVKTPVDAKPGVYKGLAKIQPEKGAAAELPLEFTVHSGTLDPLDTPAGPFGFTADVPWFDDDPAAKAFNQNMTVNGLRKMREYGLTLVSGLPGIGYRGFKDGKPDLDFAQTDSMMKLVKDLGFLAVNSYGAGIGGINLYGRDLNQMKAAGFTDYSEFIKAVFTAIQQHADAEGWIPVYWCLGDEPAGEALTEAIANAECYRKAFPKGPPFFTACSSYGGKDPNDPAYKFAKALHFPTWAYHSEDSLNLLRTDGTNDGAWASYNGGMTRWIYGDYLYKAAKQGNLKFRATWHWNNVYGDPYYCLDGRAEDFSHLNGSPDGTLILDMVLEQSRAGVNDYRRMLTLARLCKEKKGTPAAEAGERLISERLASFKFGQDNHDAILPVEDWDAFRTRINAAIDALRK